MLIIDPDIAASLPRLPLLTSEDEQRLALAVHSGDRDASRAARDELVLHSVGLARKLAGRFATKFRVPWEDFIQEALMALLIAASRYQPGRERFGTYAWWCVRRRLKKVAMRSRLVPISDYAVRLMARTDLDPDEQATADAARQALKAKARGRSDRPDAVDHTERLQDGHSPVSAEDRDWLRGSLARLDTRRREAIRLRYDEGKVLGEIGEQMGFTKQRAGMLVGEAEEKLRQLARAEGLTS